MKEYRSRETIKARRVEKPERLSTILGVMTARVGDYVARVEGGIQILSAEYFESHYAEVKGDSEFVPAGKTVEQVIEFLKANPEQVDRVKELESRGANRKGIAEYDS